MRRIWLPLPEFLSSGKIALDRVVVGSTNPVKVAAARRAFRQLITGAEVAGVSVASGVAEQPAGEDIKKKGGAIGFLTKGVELREEIYTHMVAGALVRFLHPGLYEGES